ncbi:MAG: hypothetical protein ACJAYG_002714 [Oceanicoccus sp.]|jgi:hypothetical protein
MIVHALTSKNSVFVWVEAGMVVAGLAVVPIGTVYE